jgi:F0F1-type ATP synthase membrane subunit a
MYFPFIYTLFIFILINNLIGMVPYSFASTSHFVLTFALSFTIVLGATILGFQKHGLKFFSLLVPAGCPLGLLPLLVLIEFISYLARNVSLGLRLAANYLYYNEFRSYILFTRFNTFKFHCSLFRFRASYSCNPSTGFCGTKFFLHKRWVGFTLI